MLRLYPTQPASEIKTSKKDINIYNDKKRVNTERMIRHHLIFLNST